jgi:hypothetical protein
MARFFIFVVRLYITQYHPRCRLNQIAIHPPICIISKIFIYEMRALRSMINVRNVVIRQECDVENVETKIKMNRKYVWSYVYDWPCLQCNQRLIINRTTKRGKEKSTSGTVNAKKRWTTTYWRVNTFLKERHEVTSIAKERASFLKINNINDYELGALWSSGQCAQRLVEVSHRIGDQCLLSRVPCFGRHVKLLVPIAFAVVRTHTSFREGWRQAGQS